MTDHDDPAAQVPGKEPSGAAKQFGGFAPGLVGFTDDVLFGQVWTRPELSPRDRSLVTVTALTTAGNTEQLNYHLGLARQNGVLESELIEAITHLAFYAGWPRPCRPWPWPSRSSPKSTTRSKEESPGMNVEPKQPTRKGPRGTSSCAE